MQEPYKLITDGHEVRGLYEVAFTPDYLVRLGRAYGILVNRIFDGKSGTKRRVVLGFDARPSSWDLQNALVRGLCAEGINVLNLGMAPSPLVNFSAFHLKTEGAISLTGSHRPAGWNGARLYIGRQPLEKNLLDEILANSRHIGRRDLLPMIGEVTYLNMVPDYLRSMQREFEPAQKWMGSKPIHVVVAGGNGVAALTAPQALTRIGCRVLRLRCSLEAADRASLYDPSDPAALRELGQTVRAARADFGVIFDGDGDRLRIVDNQGEAVRPDHLMLLFAQSMADHHPGVRVACDLRTTDRLEEALARRGGTLVHLPPGHRSMMEAIRTGQVLFAGDAEGHYHFADRYLGFDDGTYASLRLVELLARARKDRSEMVSIRSLLPQADRYVSPEKVIPLDSDGPILNAVADRLREQKDLGLPIRSIREDHTHAVRITLDDGWGVFYLGREDGTARIRYEGRTEQAFQAVGKILRAAAEDLIACKAATAETSSIS